MKPTTFDEALSALDLSAGELEPLAHLPGSFFGRTAASRRAQHEDEFPLQRLEWRNHRFLQLRTPALERWACALFVDKDHDRSFAIESLSAPTKTFGRVQALDRGLWWLDPGSAGAGAIFDRFVVVASREELFIGRQRNLPVHKEAGHRSLAKSADDDSPRASEVPHKGFRREHERPPMDDLLSFTSRTPRGLSGVEEESARRLREIAEGHAASPWLSKLARSQTMAATSYSQAVCAGLYARLWTPPLERQSGSAGSSPEELGGLLEVMLAESSPATLAPAWFATLDTTTQQSIEEESLQTADALQRTLPELAALATSRSPGRLQGSLQRWATARDDLASIARLLEQEPGQSELGVALSRLDREAAAHLSCFAEVELDDDPRLRAVSWQEPESWWGQLAVPRAVR